MQGLLLNPRARAPELFSDAQWAGDPHGTSAVPSVTQCVFPKRSVPSRGFKGLYSKSSQPLQRKGNLDSQDQATKSSLWMLSCSLISIP